MIKIINTIADIFDIFTAFMPPTVFFIVIPFVGLMALMKIIKEVH